jgi:hypothetical protein
MRHFEAMASHATNLLDDPRRTIHRRTGRRIAGVLAFI